MKGKKGNIIFGLLLVLLLIPYTRKEIQIFLNRYLVFSPKIIASEAQQTLIDYDWQLNGVNVPDLNLAAAKGQVVVLNSWATWCPPCIAEMPSFQNLYTNYKGKVHFVFVSNEKLSTLEKFLAKNEYTLPVYQNVGNVPKLLQHTSLPTTYIIDRNGKIVIQKSGSADWDSQEVFNHIDVLLSKRDTIASTLQRSL